tara:strand:+ start:77 stop:397 length:321 start_codon:yes stop_codon:yes gene_type:complete
MNSNYISAIHATSQRIPIPTSKKPPPELPEDRFLDDQGNEIYHSHKHQEKAQQTKLAKDHMIHTIETSSSAYTESELKTMDMQQLTRVCTQVTSLCTGPILNESDR